MGVPHCGQPPEKRPEASVRAGAAQLFLLWERHPERAARRPARSPGERWPIAAGGGAEAVLHQRHAAMSRPGKPLPVLGPCSGSTAALPPGCPASCRRPAGSVAPAASVSWRTFCAITAENTGAASAAAASGSTMPSGRIGSPPAGRTIPLPRSPPRPRRMSGRPWRGSTTCRRALPSARPAPRRERLCGCCCALRLSVVRNA